MKTFCSWRPGVLAIHLFLLLPATARGEDTPQVAEARQKFKDGAELVQKAQWAEALAAFEQSVKLRPHAITTYNIGVCERALGRYTRARATLGRALAENGQAAAGGAQQLPDSLAAEAHGYVDEIERVLAHVRVHVDPPDAAIAIDGRPLEVAGTAPPVLLAGTLPAGVGSAPPQAAFELVIDPGTHVITLSRKGFADVVVNRTLPPGDHSALELSLDRLPATLHVASNTDGAVVTVNGLDVGVAPVAVQRPGGSYHVAVKKAGHVTYETQVTVRPGEDASLRAQLVVQKTPVYKRWWFWSAAGAVVVGAILGGYFGAQAAQTPKVDGGGLGWAIQLR
jgi:hypothetical protein